MDVRIGPQRKLSAKELMLLKCGVGEYSWESLGLQGYHANQSWIFIGRTDAETPILWPTYAKSWLIRKDPDAGNNWRQPLVSPLKASPSKGMTENEMVGWHHQLDGHEFEQAPGTCAEQESLGCCNQWGHKESDMTERLNWTEFQFSMTISKGSWEWITYLNPEFLKEVLAAGIMNLQHSLV